MRAPLFWMGVTKVDDEDELETYSGSMPLHLYLGVALQRAIRLQALRRAHAFLRAMRLCVDRELFCRCRRLC